MTTIAIVGDSTAIPKLEASIQLLQSNSINYNGQSGLPINHVLMNTLLQSAQDYDKVFWCCGTPWHGSRNYIEIIKNIDKPVPERLITSNGPYWGQRITEKFNNYLAQTTEEIRDLLKQNFLEILDWMLLQYPNTIIFPVCAYNIEQKWPGISAYPEICQRRCVDLEKYGFTDPTQRYFVDPLGHLSPAGWEKFVDFALQTSL